MTAKRIVVSGGSGWIGTHLVEFLRERGDDVHLLTRDGGPSSWNPAAESLDPDLLRGADAVVNLNGVGIGDKRWTQARKDLILASRVDPTSLLAETIAAMDEPPRVFVSASAIGFYGDTGDTLVDESAHNGSDFQAVVCAAWEAAADPARSAGIRVVHPRTGVVLGRGGGALKPMTPLFKMGVGGPLGDGSQWWSWISMRDEVRALAHLIDGELDGPVNLVAPTPVTNRAFTKAFGEALGRPAVVPVPKFALDLRLGSELAASLGYGSVRVAPAALADSGFRFEDETVEVALGNLFQ